MSLASPIHVGQQHLGASPIPRWRTFVAALLITTIALIAWWSVYPPIYFSNDDVFLRLAIAGQDIPGESATPYLLNTHVALAAAAMAMQRALPMLPVWDFVVAVSLVLGLATLLTLVWDVYAGSSAVRLTMAAALLVVILPLSMGLQFTIGAVLCGGAAILLLATDWSRTSRPRLHVIAAALALLVFACLVRPMGAEAGALVTGVLCAAAAAFSPTPWPRLRRLTVIGTGTLVLLGGLNVIDSALYPRQGGWADYARYHSENLALFEWGGRTMDRHNAAIRAAAGWTENDWMMMQVRLGTDASRFGIEQMRAAADAAAASGATDSALGRILERPGSFYRRRLIQQVVVSAVLALITAACLMTFRGFIMVGSVVAVFIVLCGAITAAYKELPFRLLAPLELCMLTVAVVAAAEHWRPFSRHHLGFVVTVTVVLLGVEARMVTATARVDEVQIRMMRQQVSEVLAMKPSLLVVHTSLLAERYWRPFEVPQDRLNYIKLLRNNQSPRMQHFLTSTGRGHLLRSMCEDPSTLLTTRPEFLEPATRYLKEHEGLDATWQPVFSRTLKVWRCHVNEREFGPDSTSSETRGQTTERKQS